MLGSALPQLLSQSSETLAGRIAYFELSGLNLREIGAAPWSRLWLRGGFPRSFLASNNAASEVWRGELIRTFLERDIPQLGISIPAPTLRRFWTMLAHYHGQIWNSSEFARSFGLSDTTVRNYLDLLASALVIRLLRPWHANLSKRQVKAPKIYFADKGLLHYFLGLRSLDQLETHPRVGASWEGFVIWQILQMLDVRSDECWFWSTHASAELDLLLARRGLRIGFEIKRTSAPRRTRSMEIALSDLQLDHLYIIHLGEHAFKLTDSIDAIPFSNRMKLPGL